MVDIMTGLLHRLRQLIDDGRCIEELAEVDHYCRLDLVAPDEIESAEYYHWLAEKKLSDSQAARASFANEKYGKENKD